MHAYVYVLFRKELNLARKQQNTSVLTARLTRGLGQFSGVKVQEAAYDHVPGSTLCYHVAPLSLRHTVETVVHEVPPQKYYTLSATRKKIIP